MDRYVTEMCWFGIGALSVPVINGLSLGQPNWFMLAAVAICLILWFNDNRTLFDGGLFGSREVAWLFIGLMTMNLVTHWTQGSWIWAAVDLFLIWFNWNVWLTNWARR